MEKLFELYAEDRYDLLVLDTPPTRNALDFLEAPRRLMQFIEGRALQVFMRPTGLGMRVFGRGTSMMFSILRRVTGVEVLEDLSEFFQAFSGMVGGFRERAKRVSELLARPETTFLVVCGAQGEPIDEAVYFHRKLVEAKLPFGGVIVNKVHYESELPGDDGRLAKDLNQAIGDPDLADRVLRKLRRLPRPRRAGRSKHHAADRRDASPISDPGAIPGQRRPRPGGTDGDQPVSVRGGRQGAERDRRNGAGSLGAGRLTSQTPEPGGPRRDRRIGQLFLGDREEGRLRPGRGDGGRSSSRARSTRWSQVAERGRPRGRSSGGARAVTAQPEARRAARDPPCLARQGLHGRRRRLVGLGLGVLNTICSSGRGRAPS